MKPFEEVLPDVFGERHGEFSPELRERLQQVYREGVKQGLYLERERLPVPEDIFKLWERPAELPKDPRQVPGRLDELDEAKTVLVDLIEVLGLEVERCLRPERTLGKTGEDLAKARHQFLVMTQALMRTINKATETVRGTV